MRKKRRSSGLISSNRHGQLQDGRQLIRSDVWSAMWTEQAKLSPLFLAGIDKSDNRWPVKDHSVGYGLFWFINKYRGGWLWLCASGRNNNSVLVYVLFLQTGAHNPLQSKEQNHENRLQQAFAHALSPTHMHARTHTHTHTHTYTHTHTHTRARAHSVNKIAIRGEISKMI